MNKKISVNKQAKTVKMSRAAKAKKAKKAKKTPVQKTPVQKKTSSEQQVLISTYALIALTAFRKRVKEIAQRKTIVHALVIFLSLFLNSGAPPRIGL
jgi:predicted transcriptional regulator